MVELGVGGRVGVWLAAALVLGGCTVRPPMDPGVPLHVKRGHCFFVATEFKQRGVAKDQESVLQELSKEPRSAPYIESGQSYRVGQAVLAVAAGVAGVVETLSYSGDVQLSDEAKIGVFVGGIGSAIGAWVMCDAAEGKYAAAAQAYSAPLRGGEPDEPPEPVEDTEYTLPPPIEGPELH